METYLSVLFSIMISAIAWVPKGASSSNPKQQEPSAEELEEVRDQLQRKVDRGLKGGADDEDMSDEEEDGAEGSSDEMEEADSSEEGSEDAVARARAMAAAVASTSGSPSKKRAAGSNKAATDSIEASLRELVSCALACMRMLFWVVGMVCAVLWLGPSGRWLGARSQQPEGRTEASSPPK